MTSQEYARKILESINPFQQWHDGAIESVAKFIEEAQREERAYWQEFIKLNFKDKSDGTDIIGHEEGYAEGFRAAREKAKGIADSFKDGHPHNFAYAIAQRISELKP